MCTQENITSFIKYKASNKGIVRIFIPNDGKTHWDIQLQG